MTYVDRLTEARRLPARSRPWTVERDQLPVFEEDFVTRLREEVVILLSGHEEVVPRLPRVALEVMRLADDPRASSGSVSRVLRLDPLLAGCVLQRANAVWSRRCGGRIPDLERAVARLGLGVVRDIVLAAALRQKVFRGSGRPRMQEIWLRSMGTAVACELIARTMRRRGAQGYMLGLLHAVGDPITVRVVEDLVEGPLSGRLDLEQGLRWALPQVSLTVTSHMLRRWGFPDALVRQVEAANRGDGDAEGSVHALLSAAQHLQERCRAGGVSDASIDAFLDTAGAAALGMSRSAATMVFERFPETFDRALA